MAGHCYDIEMLSRCLGSDTHTQGSQTAELGIRSDMVYIDRCDLVPLGKVAFADGRSPMYGIKDQDLQRFTPPGTPLPL